MLNDFLKRFQKPSEKIDGGVVVHNDYRANMDTHYKPPISRHVLSQGIVNKNDFIAFTNEYKTEQTKLFYTDQRINAVFNYSLKNKADYGDSICSMDLEQNLDYKYFNYALGSPIGQKDFIRLLKRLEPYIVALDGRKSDDMDIIDMAENLRSVKQIDSIVRNTSQQFSVNAEVTTGKKDFVIPRKITFKFPIFKNDMELETPFEVELFLNADDGAFSAELACYNIDQLYDETVRELTASILAEIEDVSAFQS